MNLATINVKKAIIFVAIGLALIIGSIYVTNNLKNCGCSLACVCGFCPCNK